MKAFYTTFVLISIVSMIARSRPVKGSQARRRGFSMSESAYGQAIRRLSRLETALLLAKTEVARERIVSQIGDLTTKLELYEGRKRVRDLKK